MQCIQRIFSQIRNTCCIFFIYLERKLMMMMWQILISVPVAAEGIVEHQERTQTATVELVFDVELGSLEKKCSSTCPWTELCKPNCAQRRIKYDLLVSALCPSVLVPRSLRSDQILPSVQRQLHNTVLTPHFNVNLVSQTKAQIKNQLHHNYHH